jgi:hypothetical protein
MSAKTGEVSATNDLYSRLNDMDARAANALLVGFHPMMAVPASSSASASMATNEQDRAAHARRAEDARVARRWSRGRRRARDALVRKGV